MHLRNTRISLLSVYCIASSINNTVLHWILLCPISYVSSPLIYPPSLSLSLPLCLTLPLSISLHLSLYPSLRRTCRDWRRVSTTNQLHSSYLLKTSNTLRFLTRTPEHIWKSMWSLKEQAYIWTWLAGYRCNTPVLLCITWNINTFQKWFKILGAFPSEGRNFCFRWCSFHISCMLHTYSVLLNYTSAKKKGKNDCMK